MSFSAPSLEKHNSNQNLIRKRSAESTRSRSFSLSANVLEKAAGMVEAAEKLASSRKIDDALTLYEGAIEEILENSRLEIDLERILRYHFTVANYATRLVMLMRIRENREVDLAEILSSNPQLPIAPPKYSKDSLESEVFLFKVQLKMKMSDELRRTRSYRLKKYPNSFAGSDAVLWLMRNEVVSNKEDAVNVGQALVDACLIAHVDEDQPFMDSSRLYRFVERELYHLQLAMKNPTIGLASLSDLPTTPTAKKGRGKKFSGRELCDWMMKKEVLRLVERSEAGRLGQRLLDNYQIKDPDNSINTVFQDTDEAFYTISRDSASVISLHTATQKGFLNFSTDAAKWKNRYFMLVPAQRLLYYFEAEDSSKPKGIINLSHFTLVSLDESMLNKKFCFQIISHHHEGTFSFAGASEENRDQWMDALFPLTAESNVVRDEDSRQISSFRIFINEAQELPADKNYYCVVLYGGTTNGAPIAKTQVQWRCKNGAPNWSEEFTVDDLPSTVKEITVGIFSKKNPRDTEGTDEGSVAIKLDSLASHVEVDQLFPVTWGSGKLRLRFTLEEELILPLSSYKTLLDLTTQNFEIPKTLLELTSNLDREQFAQTVLRILEAKGRAFDFLLGLIRADVQAVHEPAVVFRLNSAGTKAVVEYMKMVGQSYITNTLHPPLQTVIQAGLKPEDNATMTPELANELDEVFGSIFSSVNRLPLQMRRLFSEIRKICIQRFPDDPNIGQLSVSAFLFLRFLCPAIVSPAVFGILDDVPDGDSSRVFKLLGRTIQFLANLKVESQGDPKMTEYLEVNLPKMKGFLDLVSDYPKDAYFPDMSASTDLERELASYYHYLVNQSNDIIEKTSQATRDALSDVLDEVSAKYEEKWPNRSTPYQYKISLAKAAMFLS